MIKKISCIVFLLAAVVSFSMLAESNVKDKMIFSSDVDLTFDGYVIRNNEVYVLFEQYQKTPAVYKYVNEELKLLNISEKEVKKFLDEAMPFYNATDTLPNIIINETMYLTFEEIGYETYKFYIYENGKKKDVLGKQYDCTPTPMGEYIYVDKENKKIYFSGSGNDEIGLYVYDISKNIVTEIHANKIGDHPESAAYSSPIRIPNTAYLLYQKEKAPNYEPRKAVYIIEIPEWKAEIGATGKAKEEPKTEKKTK